MSWLRRCPLVRSAGWPIRRPAVSCAGFHDCINRRGDAAPIVRARSGKGRRRARLRMGAGAGNERIRRDIAPDDARRMTVRCGNDGLRRINRRAGVKYVASRAASLVCTMLRGFVGLTEPRGRATGADRSRAQRIGRGDAGRPCRANWCEYLHQQRNQDDRKEFSHPPAHQRTPFSYCH